MYLKKPCYICHKNKKKERIKRPFSRQPQTAWLFLIVIFSQFSFPARFSLQSLIYDRIH